MYTGQNAEIASQNFLEGTCTQITPAKRIVLRHTNLYIWKEYCLLPVKYISCTRHARGWYNIN